MGQWRSCGNGVAAYVIGDAFNFSTVWHWSSNLSGVPKVLDMMTIIFYSRLCVRSILVKI